MNRVQPDTSLPKKPALQTYQARIVQSSTINPSVYVYQNNANLEIAWVRDDVGVYVGTILTFNNTDYPDFNLPNFATAHCQQTVAGIETIVEMAWNKVTIKTKTTAGAYVDNGLINASFKLTVYTWKVEQYYPTN